MRLLGGHPGGPIGSRRGMDSRGGTRVGRARRLLAGAATMAVVLGSLSGESTADPAGKTTLSETIQATAGSGFNAVKAGPGEPYLTRQGPLGKAKAGRARRRTSLLFFAQFSDVHIRDTQSP